MSQTASDLSSFVQDAAPGEVANVVDDIKVLVEGNPQLIAGLDRDIIQYNIDQFQSVQIPGKGKSVISKFNQLDNNVFFDADKGVSFTYDHLRKTVTDTESYHSSTDVSSLSNALSAYVDEHYPSDAAFGAFPQDNGSIAIVIVDSKYNPSNFWNGKWKSWYILNESQGTLNGGIEIDVHYYEDGNVRLKTKKDIKLSASSSDSSIIIKKIALEETKYQQQVNTTFIGLNEGSFKALRRQLPVTRSKMTWSEAIGNYRVGQDIGGGRE